MYDWPEIRPATDAFWQGIRQELRLRGIDAPGEIERSADLEDLWRNPSLLLSQTCGFPYANMLFDDVTLVGTPAYAAIDAAPGHYFSVLIARKGNEPQSLGQLADRRFAYNMTHSQSGFAAPVRLLHAAGHKSLPEPLETGAHRASVRAVAGGSADWAAIDAVTWELARKHEPAAEGLAAFAKTPETPALPLITSLENAPRVSRIAEAVEAAIAGLHSEIREMLLITGFRRFRPDDYRPLADPLPARSIFPDLA